MQATFTDKKFKHVSNSCLDFMKRLLVRDVRYRMTTGTPFNTFNIFNTQNAQNILLSCCNRLSAQIRGYFIRLLIYGSTALIPSLYLIAGIFWSVNAQMRS